MTGSYAHDWDHLARMAKPKDLANLRPLSNPTPAQLRDMAEAHAEGYHADFPREFCPECEGRHER